MELAIIGLFAAGIRLSMSIAFAALGESVSQRAGVINVGLEGIMLLGAFLAAAGAVYTGNPWGGVAIAIVGGMLLASIHGVFTVMLGANQIVSGLAILVLGSGLSGFGYRLTIGRAPGLIPSFAPLNFGPLRDIPFIGPILFGHTLLVYLVLLLALLIYWAYPRLSTGLELRAVGENAPAADAAGINVTAYRFGAVLFSGAMAAMGGAYLVLAQVNAFVEGMVAGRGFIAVACVVFGRWSPIGVVVAALVFGFADALQIRLQTWYPVVPYQLFVITPYVVALVSLVIFARSTSGPEGLGIPFRRPRRRAQH